MTFDNENRICFFDHRLGFLDVKFNLFPYFLAAVQSGLTAKSKTTILKNEIYGIPKGMEPELVKTNQANNINTSSYKFGALS